jgi:hypothetical protein
MNKVEEKIALYTQEIKTHGITFENENLLEKVTKGLGPSIRNIMLPKFQLQILKK